MSRRLYAYRKDAKFLLTAFPPTAEKRPSKEFDNQGDLMQEVTRRAGPRLPAAVELVWDEGSGIE